MAFSSWLFWAILSAIFASLTAILAKVGVEGVSSDFAMFLRTAVVLVALTILLGTTGQLQWPSSLNTKTCVFLALSGLATGGSWLCYFRALKLGDASQVAPIDKLSVVFVAVIATLFLGEKLSAANWLGVFLIASGAILVAIK